MQYLYHNPDWVRPAYKTYWHSSYGRWSYVPNRIHYALHRIFSTYATASIYYDFIHDLGIAKEKPQRSGLQAINIPTNMIKPKENTNNIIIQLVTPDGYEIDYTTETLVNPEPVQNDSLQYSANI